MVRWKALRNRERRKKNMPKYINQNKQKLEQCATKAEKPGSCRGENGFLCLGGGKRGGGREMRKAEKRGGEKNVASSEKKFPLVCNAQSVWGAKERGNGRGEERKSSSAIEKVSHLKDSRWGRKTKLEGEWRNRPGEVDGPSCGAVLLGGS